MKTLKLSHSIISQWKQNRYEDAIGMYLGKGLPATPEMELGKLYDKKWTAYVNQHGVLPPELGGGELRNPRTQIKYRVRIPFNDEFEILLSGVPDMTDDEAITDFKCGRTEANSYIGKMQLDYYSLFKPELRVGKYLCYNPYTERLTVGVKFLSQVNRDNAINDIVTYGGEILQYLLANKLFIDFKG